MKQPALLFVVAAVSLVACGRTLTIDDPAEEHGSETREKDSSPVDPSVVGDGGAGTGPGGEAPACQVTEGFEAPLGPEWTLAGTGGETSPDSVAHSGALSLAIMDAAAVRRTLPPGCASVEVWFMAGPEESAGEVVVFERGSAPPVTVAMALDTAVIRVGTEEPRFEFALSNAGGRWVRFALAGSTVTLETTGAARTRDVGADAVTAIRLHGMEMSFVVFDDVVAR